jgi:hypothetical protein
MLGTWRAHECVFQFLRKLDEVFSRRTLVMLYKCANQACNTPFRRLQEGKLFQVETEYFSGRGSAASVQRKARPGRRIEHYWLCDACSPFVTLVFDRERGVITVPLPDGLGKKTVKVISMDPASEPIGFDDSPLQPAVHEVQK